MEKKRIFIMVGGKSYKKDRSLIQGMATHKQYIVGRMKKRPHQTVAAAHHTPMLQHRQKKAFIYT